MTFIIGRRALQVDRDQWRYPGEDCPEAKDWSAPVVRAHIERGTLIDIENLWSLDYTEDAHQIGFTADVLGIMLADIPEGSQHREKCIDAIRQVASERRAEGVYGSRTTSFLPGASAVVSGYEKATRFAEGRFFVAAAGLDP